MPEIEITDDQHEYLENLRAELDRDVVYGHVRVTDALQFLIDSHEGEIADGVEADAEADADGTGSETSVDVRTSGGDGADAVEDVDDDGLPDDEESAGDAGEPDDDAEDVKDADETDADSDDTEASPVADDDDAAADDESDADGADEETAAAAPTPGGGGRLNAMMQLLDTHEDKWREGSGDARYEVELPDGTVETAQTKDDVRALLFKNY